MSEEKGENLGLCWAHTPGKSLEDEAESLGKCVEERQEAVSAARASRECKNQELVADLGEDAAGVSRDGGDRLQEARSGGTSRTGNGKQEARSGEATTGKTKSGNKAVQERGRKVRDEMARLAGLLEAGGEQMDLLAGADELEDGDVLSVAARSVSEARRGRGRPKGAANVRNVRVFDYLEALGHRDPLVTLSLIQTADTRALARMVGMKAADALRIQVMAAKEMLPYKYAKKPQELNVNERKAHIFLTGTLDVEGGQEDDGTLSIFGRKSIS